jgi:Undecaprenyl-phosphate glucose phosphotransferase
MSNFFPTELRKARAHDYRQYQPFFQLISYQRIGVFTAIFDFALILAASIATGVTYHFLGFAMDCDVAAFAFVGCYSGLTFVLLTNALGLYRPTAVLAGSTQIRGVINAWGAVLVFVASVLFLLKTGANYSSVATIGFGFVGLGFIRASRAIIGINLRRALANETLAGRRAIVIGDPEELASKPAQHLLRTYGAQEVGRFELSATDRDRSKIEHDMAIINSAIRAARTNDAEYMLLALRWTDTWRRDVICERLRAVPLPVLLLPDRFVSSILSQARSEFSAETAFEVQRAPLSSEDLIAKRIFDLMLAFLGLVVFSVPAAVICLAIMLESPGPVIFRQRRRGFNGREFAIYKFRTMTVLEDGSTIRQARRDDPRVTRVGRLLRAASIDEVPQLINVLKGEMSLVGPRPHAVAHDDKYSNSIQKYAFRHHVKPGITGWAQINGYRGETADVALMHKRIQCDLWYINNWSLWLDLRIMARTCVVVLRPRNVY